MLVLIALLQKYFRYEHFLIGRIKKTYEYINNVKHLMEILILVIKIFLRYSQHCLTLLLLLTLSNTQLSLAYLCMMYS
jgi:hypothetical protein